MFASPFELKFRSDSSHLLKVIYLWKYSICTNSILQFAELTVFMPTCMCMREERFTFLEFLNYLIVVFDLFADDFLLSIIVALLVSIDTSKLDSFRVSPLDLSCLWVRCIEVLWLEDNVSGFIPVILLLLW